MLRDPRWHMNSSCGASLCAAGGISDLSLLELVDAMEELGAVMVGLQALHNELHSDARCEILPCAGFAACGCSGHVLMKLCNGDPSHVAARCMM